MPIDYSKSKIYRIYSPTHPEDGEYIGSTTQPLSLRMAGHRKDYRRYTNGKFNFITSFYILKYEDAKIELIAECPCENKEQLLRAEGEYIRETGGSVNRITPGITINERITYRKKYREAHKEEIAEYMRIYREKHKEEYSKYMKHYQKEHSEKCNEYKKKYRDKQRNKRTEVSGESDEKPINHSAEMDK